MYRFCIGERVDQYHVEANGTFSEEFRLGNSQMDSVISENTRQEKEDMLLIEDAEDSLKDMILSDDMPYMIIDRSTGGYLVRVYNSNQTRPGLRLKNDMIGVTYRVSEADGGHLRQETRVIVEVINDYTFIIDRPFDNLA